MSARWQIYAWNASVELLTQAGPDESAVALFAAQTIKHKLVYDWRQLDEGAMLGLRQQLWSLLFSPAASSPVAMRPVAVQLCLSLAALLVQMPEQLWPDPVGDLFAQTANVAGSTTRVLELLGMIPEQLNNRTIRFATAEEYRMQRERLLERHIDRLIQLVLTNVSGTAVPSSTGALLTCLCSWIQHGGDGSRIIESPGFLDGVFSLLHQSCQAVISPSREQDDEEEEHIGVVETSGEILLELVLRMSRHIEDWDNEEEREREQTSEDAGWFARLNEEWLPVLARNLCRMTDPLTRGYHAASPDSLAGRLVRPLLALLCEALEAFLAPLLALRDDFAILVETVLGAAECPATPPAILELTFNFWGALPSELSAFSTASSVDLDTTLEPLVPLYARLLSTLLRQHLVFPPVTTPEELDRFREFRHVVGDCLKDCVRVLGSTESLLLIGRDLDAEEPRQVEAALFALRTVSYVIDPRESEAMPAIAPRLLRILQMWTAAGGETTPVRPTPLRMLSAVLLNVGCYAEWVRYHSEHLATFLGILSGGLEAALNPTSCQLGGEQPETVVASALQSLKYTCESCGGLLGRQYDALEGLFLRVYPATMLNRRDRLDLTEAVGLVLARRTDWSDDLLLAALHRLLQLIWQQIARPGQSEAIEDYAVLLECVLQPELPRTPLIFDRVFLVSFPDLCQLLLNGRGEGEEREERFCVAWSRCMQAVLNNGTAGAVGDFVQGPLAAFFASALDSRSRGLLSSVRQGTLFGLLARIISAQYMEREVARGLLTGVLAGGLLSYCTPRHLICDVFVVEACNLVRVALIYVFMSAGETGSFIVHSWALSFVALVVQAGRPLSTAETVGCAGLLAALISNLSTDDAAAMEEAQRLWGDLRAVLVRMVEGVLAEWPLGHVNDLALLLSRLAKCPVAPLAQFATELFDRSAATPLCTLLPATSTTAVELAALQQDYLRALDDAVRHFRPRTLRSFLSSVAETCRRRHEQSAGF